MVKQHGYYRCPGRDSHRFAGQAVCDNHPVRSDRLELVVWNEIRAVLEDPRRLANEYRRRLGAPRVGPCEIDALETLERQISSLRRGISRLIDSYAEGLIDRTEFQPRITGMKQRLARLEENRQTLVETAEAEQNLALIIGRLEDFSDKVPPGSECARLAWDTRHHPNDDQTDRSGRGSRRDRLPRATHCADGRRTPPFPTGTAQKR